MPLYLLDRDTYPFIAFTQSYFPSLNGLFAVGSGVLIGPRLVLTAGHILYDTRYGGWADRIEVTLGTPVGMVRGVRAIPTDQWLQVDSQDADDGLSAYDFGVIVLPSAVDRVITPLRVETAGDRFLQTHAQLVAGFPYEPSIPLGTLYGATSPVVCPPALAALDDARLFYPIQTLGGMSGGPVCSTDGGNTLTVHGIHTSYGDTFNGVQDNLGSAVRVNEGVLALIMDWLGTYRP